MQKVKCLINKPTYAGFAVLELSKLHMYKFHYDQMRTWYPSAELLFTDTDSLVYQVYTDDLYVDLQSHREHFDFSNYPQSHPLYGVENKMVLGKMKDESNGQIITEFVGLRPKMYSYTTLQDDKLKESKRAKGIQRAAIKSITHDDYLAQLRAPAENYVNIRRIGQKHHRVYTLASMKRGLCAFDDKRYLLPCGIRTLAHGHRVIREQQTGNDDDLELDDTRTRNTPVLDETGEPIETFVVLTSAQAASSNIRTTTRAEALDSIAGIDLRQSIQRASARRSARPASTSNGPGPSKRVRLDCPADEDDDDYVHNSDDALCLIDEVAQFVSINDAF
jgi:hypothetical protein